MSSGPVSDGKTRDKFLGIFSAFSVVFLLHDFRRLPRFFCLDAESNDLDTRFRLHRCMKSGAVSGCENKR